MNYNNNRLSKIYIYIAKYIPISNLFLLFYKFAKDFE